MGNTGTTNSGATSGTPTPQGTASKPPSPAAQPGPTPPPITQATPQPPPAAVVQQPKPQPLPPVPPTITTPVPEAEPEEPTAKVTKKKTPTKKTRSPNNGRVSSEVSTIPSMRAIWNEHDKGTSYERIEENARFNLKKANGMTAYRICRKYEKLTGTKPKPAKRGRPKSKPAIKKKK